VVVDDSWERILHPLALEAARMRSLPPWLMLAGIHGEFELAFTVPPEREAETVATLVRGGSTPVRLGEISEGEGVWLRSSRGEVSLDTTSIRNAAGTAGRDPRAYVAKLLAIARATEGGRHDG
jgi:hypothetical protein